MVYLILLPVVESVQYNGNTVAYRNVANNKEENNFKIY